MHVTWLDSNSWLIELGGKQILLDPWLVGDLTFGGATWLFRGVHPQPMPIPETVDVVLLSQGLPDHAHPPTLEALNHDWQVVGSPNAASVVQGMGYTQVVALSHGETYRLGESLEIRAVPGSPVGPTLVENGYILTDLTTGRSLYYEPHGFHSDTLATYAPVDVVITPMINLELPLIGPIIKGRESALRAADLLKPQVMMPTAAAGRVQYEGLLVSVLKAVGNTDEIRASLSDRALTTQVIEPVPGERLEVCLATQTA
jgi:L-ascorbate metabolism protein UlaG (beta-lactamase superfamily)